MKEFKTDFDNLLLDNLYSRIDIYPLIKSHNGGQNAIKSSIQHIVGSYKNDGLITIDDDSIYNLAWIPPTAIKLPDREIFVTATTKLKEQNTPAVSNTTYNFTTTGHNSPIAGHDVNIGDINQPLSDLSNRPEIKPIINPTNINDPTSTKNWNPVIVIWEYISNNALIAGIIAALVAAVILLKIFGHF